jgi:hypothetical protein
MNAKERAECLDLTNPAMKDQFLSEFRTVLEGSRIIYEKWLQIFPDHSLLQHCYNVTNSAIQSIEESE